MESRDQQRQEVDREPRPARRLRAPLFDRLTAPLQLTSGHSRPYRSLELEDAVESVRKELQRLLNTRSVKDCGYLPLTTLQYGLLDFAHVSATDMQARGDLAAKVAAAIEAFEPRLTQVHVTLEPHPSGQRFLTGVITANLRLQVVPEPVSFPLEMDTETLPAEAIQISSNR